MAVKPVLLAWYIIAKNNLQSQLLTRSSAVLFVIGKLVNFFFSLILITSIYKTTTTINGYSLHQVVFFTLIYFIFESVTGFLFRAIYTFRPILVRGDFDLDLVKPLPSYFRPILSAPDFLDIPPLVVQIGFLLYYSIVFQISVTPLSLLVFSLLFVNSIILSFSLFLFIASLCILTTEVDNLVAIYRSLTRAGIVPVDVYPALFRFILNTIVPVAVFITIPVKAFLGILDPTTLVFALVFSTVFFYLSVLFWRHSLSQYSSASS